MFSSVPLEKQWGNTLISPQKNSFQILSNPKFTTHHITNNTHDIHYTRRASSEIIKEYLNTVKPCYSASVCSPQFVAVCQGSQ